MEMITLTFARELLKRNFKVDLLCVENSQIHKEAISLKINAIPIKINAFHLLKNLFKISRIIKQSNYELVHTQASKDLWLIVPALKIIRSKIPLVLTKQVGSYLIKKHFPYNFLYNRISKAFAISTEIKNNLVQTTNLTEDDIEIVFNGIDTEKFCPEKADKTKIKNEFGIKDNEIVIGMIARISPGKGHEVFLNSANVLSEKFSNLKFLIVGQASRGEDVYANQIYKLSKELNLNNVIFTGFRRDINDILAAMDIFVFPSQAEAFGIALVEALSMGIPSVCARAGGVLDIVVDKVTSLYFQIQNYLDLASKIKILIEDKTLRETFSINSRKRAIQLFDINIIMDQTINIYEKLIQRINSNL
jgi:glycosyltransferase involved in cell wall biosynthesis